MLWNDYNMFLNPQIRRFRQGDERQRVARGRSEPAGETAHPRGASAGGSHTGATGRAQRGLERAQGEGIYLAINSA